LVAGSSPAGVANEIKRLARVGLLRKLQIGRLAFEELQLLFWK
jgi:hypothetical protein